MSRDDSFFIAFTSLLSSDFWLCCLEFDGKELEIFFFFKTLSFLCK